MIATFKVKGNVGFLIYFADAFGYLGSVIIILLKETTKLKIEWTYLYSNGVLFFAFVGVIGTILSFRYFNRKYYSIKIYG
jgi:hypothetical protein